MSNEGFLDTSQIDAVKNAIVALTAEQQALILSSQGVNQAQQVEILTSQGVSQEKAVQVVRNQALNSSNQAVTTSTLATAGAFSVLNIAIGAATAAISVALIAYNAYQSSQRELRQETQQAAEAYNASAESIRNYQDEIVELRGKLQEEGLESEEIASIKSRLLDIQEQLTNSYSKQAAGIDILNGSLSEQIELTNTLLRLDSIKYLNENENGIRQATEALEELREYNIGIGYGIQEYHDEILQLADDIEGLNLINYAGTFFLQFTGDVWESQEAFNEFATQLRERMYELEKEGVATEWANDLLSQVSSVLGDINQLFDENLAQYEEGIKARINSNEDYAEIYTAYLSSILDLNDAIAKGSQEEITAAAERFRAAQNEVDGLVEKKPEFERFFDGLRTGLNETGLEFYEFMSMLREDDSLSQWTEQLQGLSDIDIREALSTDKVLEHSDAVRALTAAAEEYGISQETLIKILQDMGVLVSNVTETIADTRPVITDIADAVDYFANSMEGLEKQYSTLESAAVELATTGALTADSLQKITQAGLLEYLELVDGELRINIDALEDQRQLLIEDTRQAILAGAAQEIYAIAMRGTANEVDNTSDASSGFASVLNAVEQKLYDVIAAASGAKAELASLQAVLGNNVELTRSQQDEIDGVLERTQALLTNLDNLGSSAQSFGTRMTNAMDSAKSSTKDATDALKEYKKELEGDRSAIESLLSDVTSMLKQQYADRKAALQDQLSSLKENYDYEKQRLNDLKSTYIDSYNTQKEYLQDLKSQNDERYKDEKSNLDSLKKDFDAYYKSRKAALDAEKKEFEKNYNAEKKYLDSIKKERDKQYKADTKALQNQRKQMQAYYKALIADIKNVYQEQNKIYDAQKKALQDQLDAYEAIINKELELLNLKDQERTYEQQLAKLNQDMTKLQNELNVLEYDDSIEAQRRKLELIQQIANKQTEIDELQYQRGKTLQEQALKDELQRYKDMIQGQIDAIQERQDAEKEAYENTIAQIEAERDAYLESIDAQLTALQEQKEYLDELHQQKLDQLQDERDKFNDDYSNRLDLLNNEKDVYYENHQAKLDQLQAEKDAFDKDYQSRIKMLDAEKKEYERNHQDRLKQIEDEYNAEKARLDQQIKDIDNYTSNSLNLRKEAIAQIESRSQELYNNLILWNRQYGSTNRSLCIVICNENHTYLQGRPKALHQNGRMKYA